MARKWSEPVKLCPKHPGKVDGRWCRCQKGIQWRYRMGEPDPVTGVIGKPRWSPRFPTLEAADDHQLKKRATIASGTYAPDRGLTVSAYLDEWLAARTRMSRGEVTTSVGYHSLVENWLKPTLGPRRLSSLSVHHAQAAFDSMAAGPSHRRDAAPPSPGTLVNIRACLRSALADAQRQQLVAQNVATLVRLPKVTRRKRQPLTREQLRRFLEHVTVDDLAALWILAIFTGMRRGELCGLRWDHVDLTTATIRVRKQVAAPTGLHACNICGGKHRGRLYKDLKSDRSRRDIPVHRSLVTVLTGQRQKVEAMAAQWPGEWSDHDLVFPHPGGRGELPGSPVRPEFVGHRFTDLLASSGIDTDTATRPTLHTLRAGLLTLVMEEGVSADVAAQVAGHADADVTRDWYLRASSEVTRAVLEAVVSGVSDPDSDPGNSAHENREDVVRAS